MARGIRSQALTNARRPFVHPPNPERSEKSADFCPECCRFAQKKRGTSDFRHGSSKFNIHPDHLPIMKIHRFRSPSILLASFSLALASAGSSGAATIVFEDNFGDPNGTFLNGSNADTGQPWTAGGLTMSGGQLNFPATSGGQAAKVTFPTGTFVPGCIYRLSTQLTLTSANGGNWIAFGFSDFIASNPLISGSGSMFVRDNLQAVPVGDAFALQPGVSPGPGAPWNLFEVELTTGSTLSNSSIQFFIDGNQIGPALPSDASNVDTIFYQTIGSGVTGTSDFLRLTHAPVPEPSTAILGLGSIGLLLRRRRTAPPQ
jgi:PEP-CTERM motif